MRDNTINNYFAGSKNSFLEELSPFQSQTFTYYRVLEPNEVWVIDTPKNCWKYEMFAGADLAGTTPASGLLVNLLINENKVLLKLNDFSFPFAPLIPVSMDGVPYIQKSDNIIITGPPDVEITVSINFFIIIPKNT